MTLCVAWRYERKFCMAADSCVTVAARHEPFGGIKVLEIPIDVVEPIKDVGGGADVYKRAGGLCFAGPFHTALLLKEAISELLSHLQFVHEPASFSFDHIAQFVFRFYSHLALQFRQSLNETDTPEIVLGGYCPLKKGIRVYRLFFNEDGTIPCIQEILLGEPFSYHAFGVGAERFERLFQPLLKAGGVRVHFEIPRTIREVIRDREIPSVDGAIQYGEFHDGHNFRLFGIVDGDASGENESLFIRGSNLKAANLEDPSLGLFVAYQAIAPFRAR